MKVSNSPRKHLYYTSVFATPVNALLVVDPEGKLYYASLGQNITNLQNLLVKDFQHQKHVQLKPLSTIHDKCKATETVERFKQLIEDPRKPQEFTIEIIFGTRLQRRIWQELMKMPIGEVKTYTQIADGLNLLGKYARVIGAGCSSNRIAIVVPCHRAVGSDKQLTGYRYGKDTKAYLLKHELGDKLLEIGLASDGAL